MKVIASHQLPLRKAQEFSALESKEETDERRSDQPETTTREPIAKFSLERDVEQYRSEEKGGYGMLQPGGTTKTGCTVLFPRKMTWYYDKAQRTVVIES
ncbi:hypothetical protein CBER1_02336 [Cercospora berteroae]|uniref:Uncharacterized protein n=1 Tax=Cercospora berteroae TaxID=357750 RepID=A0A2S6CM56_9PEZI|nr:hypothetical protein CBER1_02336 [Cercospora berteroae]